MKIVVSRCVAGSVGLALLIAGVLTVRDLGEQAYYEYYLFPRVKDAYVVPMRWQDLAATLALWVGAFLMLYGSYRLLKWAAFRRSHWQSETRQEIDVRQS